MTQTVGFAFFMEKRGKGMNGMDIILQVDHISKKYSGKEDFWAIRQAHLSVFQGEILGITGCSGAGKSTLLRCMNLLEPVSAGKVFFHGEDLCQCTQRQLNYLRSKMGMIFQQFQLFDQKTVLQNVCFPLQIHGVTKRNARARAMKFLEWVGLEHKAQVYPQTLSGGQKQRVAIARALVGNPKLLLCDEATSALDPETTGIVIDLLKKANQEMGVTIVFISHQLEVVERLATRVVEMKDGYLNEDKQIRSYQSIRKEEERWQASGFR